MHARCLQLDSTRWIFTRPARSAASLGNSVLAPVPLDKFNQGTVTVGQSISHIGFDSSSSQPGITAWHRNVALQCGISKQAPSTRLARPLLRIRLAQSFLRTRLAQSLLRTQLAAHKTRTASPARATRTASPAHATCTVSPAHTSYPAWPCPPACNDSAGSAHGPCSDKRFNFVSHFR